MRLAALVLLLSSCSLWGGEFAVFASGARMHVDRHEAVAGKVKLYIGEGFSELDASMVTAFEPDGLPAAASTAIAEGLAAGAKPNLSPRELADAAADKYGLPRQLVRSVMAAESGFQAQAKSAKGAIGLMQLMPETAQALGVDPYDPAQNVDAGARYLRDLLNQYNYGLWHALAAYNAGPGAVDKYQGIPPYAETIRYVERIDREYRQNQ
ncbi:MAG: lytic transglycosylase domain-containing protein [Bryobacteraceae bacterium]|jgi:soluble lytic murein transglycosylase-like protein